MVNRGFPRLFFLVPAGFLLAGCLKSAEAAKTYDFTEVRRGSLEKTVSAGGTLKPVATVNVLARMSGKVESIHVDYNDRIRKGDILAELNTDMLRLQREQQLASVIKARANHELQLLNYQNQEKLAEKNLISEYELKSTRTALNVQAAELSAAEASLRVIETEINQYALITSPIDGIVLERSINEGDTVMEGSSTNSSSIFILAENLEEMQIEAAVGELDIPVIRQGQTVRFTLEALPGKSYTGTVKTVHLMPAIQDNVVSYTVIIDVDNRDGTLFPGMTCAVEFIEEQNEGILMVPNAALRYQPVGLSADDIAERIFNAGLSGVTEEQRAEAQTRRRQTETAQGQNRETRQGGLPALMTGGGGFGGPPMGGRGGPGNTAGQRTTPAAGQGPEGAPKTLWYLNAEGKLDCLLVRTGISDGSFTEIRPVAAPEETLLGKQVILRERV